MPIARGGETWHTHFFVLSVWQPGQKNVARWAWTIRTIRLPARQLRTRFICSIIHAMMILIVARLVQRVAIRAVAERRAFVANRRFEHRMRRVGHPLPLGSRKLVAPHVPDGCGRDAKSPTHRDCRFRPRPADRASPPSRPAGFRPIAHDKIRAVTVKASGPSLAGPKASSNSFGEIRRTFPSPRRSQYRNSPNPVARQPAAKPQMLVCRRLGH